MQRGLGYIAGIIFLFSFFNFAQAACLSEGYTVVFVNGIFNTREQAQISAEKLQFKLGKTFKSQDVVVRAGYNPSHLAGLGDLVQIAAQSFGASFSSFDRDTIL